LEGETILIALNASEAASKVALDGVNLGRGKKRILFGQVDVEAEKEAIRLNIPPRSSTVLKIQ
jgi:hypothetical protein